MSAFKGTPGPWRVDPSHCGDVQTLDGQWEVACTSPLVLTGGECPDEWRANARLIAAAPELLEVAQRSADALRSAGIEPRATSDNPLEWLLHQTEAAISKATGEQP